jgi:hypothetical protein
MLMVGCSSGPYGDPAPTTSEPEATKSSLSAEGGGGGVNHAGPQDARDAGHNPDPGAFGASCTSGSDCESDVCFSGGKGGFCSLNCTSEAQCPAGADGTQHCNPHGYCRY